VIIHCNSCGTRYKIRDELVSSGPKRARCKKCGATMIIEPPKEEVSVGAAEPSATLSQKTSPEVPDSGADLENKAAEDTATAGAVEQEGRTEAESEQASPAEGGEVAAGEKKAAGEKTGTEIPQPEDIVAKLEKRRRQMEDEISGRLNKAALETLDFDVLEYLARKLKAIEENPEYKAEEDTKLFTCINCKTIFSLFPDDPRQCTNCSGEAALVRGEDILRQFGMFSR